MELQAKAVTRQYFRQSKGSNVFTAVHETDLTVSGGILTEITGRSGSGKSTLLHMLAGLLQPTAGQVLLDGTDLYRLPDAELAKIRNQKIGIVPQGQTALRALTVLENVVLPAQFYGSAGNPEERAHMLLEKVGIAGLADVRPDELSGGERRRLAIARALIMQPGVLLADEPTADLDDENTRMVLRLLRQCADDGLGVLLVTHEAEAAAYADQVLHMDAGLVLSNVKKITN